MARLNRTSVGLKPHPDQEQRQDGDGPQSNQRGIETEAKVTLRIRMGEEPQSNQRGIETILGSEGPIQKFGGLNRTSVGLKLGSDESRRAASAGPQSNQRGIETGIFGEEAQVRVVQASIEPAWD